jgi:hypothetical protein
VEFEVGPGGANETASAGTIEAETAACARHKETTHCLVPMPSTGPTTSFLIDATLTGIGSFQSARLLAAWLCVMPRQHPPAENTSWSDHQSGQLGCRLLILRATSVVRRAAG